MMDNGQFATTNMMYSEMTSSSSPDLLHTATVAFTLILEVGG